MIRILTHLVANGLAVVLLARLLPSQVQYTDGEAVAVFAIVLALLNAVLRPILPLVTFPITCLTFGLFALIVNGVVFYLAGQLSDGIDVTFLGAVLGAITQGVLSGLIWSLFENRKW